MTCLKSRQPKGSKSAEVLKNSQGSTRLLWISLFSLNLNDSIKNLCSQTQLRSPLTDHTTLLILKTQLEAQLEARVPQASKEWTAGWVLIPHYQHSIAVPPSAY